LADKPKSWVVTIEIPPDLQADAMALAKREKETVTEWVLTCVRERVQWFRDWPARHQELESILREADVAMGLDFEVEAAKRRERERQIVEAARAKREREKAERAAKSEGFN